MELSSIRLFTFPYFSRGKTKRVLQLMSAILISNEPSLTWGRVSNLLCGRGTVWEEARKIFFSPRPPPLRPIIPNTPPPVYLKIKIAVIKGKTRSIFTIPRKNKTVNSLVFQLNATSLETTQERHKRTGKSFRFIASVKH